MTSNDRGTAQVTFRVYQETCLVRLNIFTIILNKQEAHLPSGNKDGCHVGGFLGSRTEKRDGIMIPIRQGYPISALYSPSANICEFSNL